MVIIITTIILIAILVALLAYVHNWNVKRNNIEKDERTKKIIEETLSRLLTEKDIRNKDENRNDQEHIQDK